MAETYLDSHKVQQLTALEGRAKVSYPYGDTAFPRIERVMKVDLQDLASAFLTADEEYPAAVLIEQTILSQDDQYARVFRAWETFPGPWIPGTRYDTDLGPIQTRRRAVLTDPASVATASGTSRTTYEARDDSELVSWETQEEWSDGSGSAGNPAYPARLSRVIGKYGTFEETVRQTVPAGTNPAAGGPTDSERVDFQAPGLGELVKRHTVDGTGGEISGGIVDSEGAELLAGLIVTLPVRYDTETGTPIYTDRFMASLDYALPVLDWGSGVYAEWKQPNPSRVGYSNTSYHAPRYPIDARKMDVPDSAYCLVEVDYCRIPSPQVRYKKVGFRFPAVFDYNTDLVIGSDYKGSIRPPWNIGAQSPNGFSFLAHRQSTQAAQVIHTYSLGPRVALPLSYNVRTPGAASKVFSGIIPEECIHPAIVILENVSSGGQSATYIVEDIPPSTPASYQPSDILVESADEDQWRAGIYMQTVVLVSESRPVTSFPDPQVSGYYAVAKDFLVGPDELLTGVPAGKPVYLQTVAAGGGAGSESVKVALRGTDNTGGAGVIETVAASPTLAGSATAFQTLSQVVMANPLSSDTLVVLPAVEPDTCVVSLAVLPGNGDTLEIGYTGSTTVYTFNATLASAANQIQIATTLIQQRDNIIAALRATSYAGVAFSSVTAPNASFVATRGDGSRELVFATRSPTLNTDPSGLVLKLTIGGIVTAGNWTEGQAGAPMVQLHAGETLALRHAQRALTNPALLDANSSNDTQATATLPEVPIIYTQWLQVPAGKAITLRYNATGGTGIRVWWQNSASGAAPATTTVSVSVTAGSTAIGPAFATGDIGKPILLPGDPRENLIAGSTTLLNKYQGTTGTVAATVTQTVVSRLPNALGGQLREVAIGIPAATWLRLRFEQQTTPSARAVAAQAQWLITPDD